MNYKFQKPARSVSRVFLHCSASDDPAHDSAAVIDGWHRQNGWSGIGYHFFIRKDGRLEVGRDLEQIPAAQAGNNTGTIAICLHGLDVKLFTDAQFDTLRALCQQIDAAYSGQVTFHGHSEVAAKACPVFDYREVLGLDKKGKLLSNSAPAPSIQVVQKDGADLEVLRQSVEVLKFGMKSNLVRALQATLTGLGYFTGGTDGDFGKMTRAAVLSFQADNGLATDGAVGALTREALAEAQPRELMPARLSMSLSELAAKGSKVAKATRSNIAVGAILGTGGLATIIDQVTDQADLIRKLFDQHGLLTGAVILAAGAFVAWQSWRAGQSHLTDHRSGKIT